MWGPEEFPCTLPRAGLPEDVSLSSAEEWLSSQLENLSEASFTKDAIWRDCFALTGTLRTFYTSHSVIEAWRITSRVLGANSFQASPTTAKVTRLGVDTEWVDIHFTFETKNAPSSYCSGYASLIYTEQATWKIWVLRTILEQLKGQESVDSLDEALPNGAPSEAAKIESNSSEDSSYFDCVVVGGGQAGLSCGGRLKALSVSYVVLDRNDQVGDSWKTRYDSAKLHTTREFSHLPFDRTFPKSYREFLTKDDLAKGYQDWVKKFGINVWQKSTLISGAWNESESVWELNVERQGGFQPIRSAHVILAAGGGCQVPVVPKYADEDNFEGAILHSSEYKSAKEWAGKHGIVIGTANTAHDVAEDMVAAGMASVTMVQRSPTYVLPYEYYKAVLDTLYNESIPTEIADRIFNSNPLALTRLLSNMMLNSMAEKEPERFNALEAAGFKVERYGDLVYSLYNRFGGHYMDVGASAKIAKGLIKVKSDALPIEYLKEGLRFTDGSDLKADIIVFATGFVGNMRNTVHELFGLDVAGQVEDFWGVDAEGELKGAFKPTGHPRLWYHGGALGHARYFSRFLALQIKASLLGSPLPIYRDTPERSQGNLN